MNEFLIGVLSLPNAVLAGFAGAVGAVFGGIVGTLVSKLFRTKNNFVTIIITVIIVVVSTQVLNISLPTLRKEMGVESKTGG